MCSHCSTLLEMSIYLEINKQLNYSEQQLLILKIAFLKFRILFCTGIFFYHQYHKNKIKLEVQKNNKGPPRDWKDKKGEGNDNFAEEDSILCAVKMHKNKIIHSTQTFQRIYYWCLLFFVNISSSLSPWPIRIHPPGFGFFSWVYFIALGFF